MYKKQKIHLLYILIVLISSLILVSCGDDTNNPTKSSDKKIISFRFEQLDPTAIGIIDETTKTVTVNVPANTDITNMIPTIVISNGATINPASGVARNFTTAQKYTVTAEDATVVEYTVIVSKGNVTDPQQLNGTLTENTTLPNRNDAIDYIIDGGLYVEGNALLTIEPGVKILFTNTSGYLQIGDNCGIRAIGTPEKPIIFDGPVNNNNPGAWGGISIRSQRNDNEFQYVIINNAGANSNVALDIAGSAKLKMSNTKITNSATTGLYLEHEASISIFKNNEISNCNEYPILLNNIKQAENFDASSTFLNNKKNVVSCIYGELYESFTLKKINIPYYVLGLTLENGTLTIEEGVEIKFDGNGILIIFDNAMINAKGTVANPIIFTGYTEVKGFWRGLDIRSKLDNDIKNCIIKNTGKDDSPALNLIGCKINLENVSIISCSYYGIVYDENSEITHSNILFDNCPKGNVYNYSTDETFIRLP